MAVDPNQMTRFRLLIQGKPERKFEAEAAVPYAALRWVIAAAIAALLGSGILSAVTASAAPGDNRNPTATTRPDDRGDEQGQGQGQGSDQGQGPGIGRGNGDETTTTSSSTPPGGSSSTTLPAGGTSTSTSTPGGSSTTTVPGGGGSTTTTPSGPTITTPTGVTFPTFPWPTSSTTIPACPCTP